MLDSDDRAVLIDFGLSRRLGIAGPVALGELFDLSGEGRFGSGLKRNFVFVSTVDGSTLSAIILFSCVAGTLVYSAPELLRLGHAATLSSDV